MTQPKTRPLGNSGLSVPLLTFGGNVFGWTVDEKTSFSLLDALVEKGLFFIDTADVYSRWAPGNQGGESETIIGKWLKKSGKRDRIVLATKVGIEMSPEKQGLKPGYIRQAVEDSLRRLQTDVIDLYQAHRDDETTPLTDTLSAFDALIKAGKVRAIGASNYSAARLQEALDISKQHGLARYETLQPLYNLYDREEYESELEQVARENQLGVINYYALASGFLSGKYKKPQDASKSARGQGIIDKYLNERGKRIVEALEDVAASHDASATQVALAWLIARPSITSPIVSATSLSQLDELVKATELTLSKQEIEELSQASKP
ncbi:MULTISPECIES: aldo/keto reductase [Pantoea]|uniref:Alcohol dehydrogenase n=1 Tax=Pantoea stewartii subsp. stewartii DC283 TaxID=660596 RepID=H3RJD3_PANSE|nr:MULTISPECIES: aldo/keto reductase [Pantoea]ARF48485.1 alcohol dehydrogenase [Pantoea stewartii subsp. stewartii DC283]EHT98390.1 putative oxidoreductase [Pantoea stewartii subsp. stewartii DC283]KAB0551669.1 aldo/keto reductase [Pantoea stewartii subsp. stewartii]MDF7787404.1 aldo/keto reductase [Pantoea stewartii]MDK2632819.1 aldo/keto reductase [Pantoea stewartii subsp. indologenes]